VAQINQASYAIDRRPAAGQAATCEGSNLTGRYAPDVGTHAMMNASSTGIGGAWSPAVVIGCR